MKDSLINDKSLVKKFELRPVGTTQIRIWQFSGLVIQHDLESQGIGGPWGVRSSRFQYLLQYILGYIRTRRWRILYFHHVGDLSLIHISEPTRLLSNSYAVFCLKKKKLE